MTSPNFRKLVFVRGEMGDDLQQKFAINYFIIKLSYVLRRLSLWFSRSRSKNRQKLFLNMLSFSFILGLIFFPLFQIHYYTRSPPPRKKENKIKNKDNPDNMYMHDLIRARPKSRVKARKGRTSWEARHTEPNPTCS